MALQLSPAELPYEATGLSYIWTLRSVDVAQAPAVGPGGPEIPLALFVAQSRPVVWTARKVLLYPINASTLVHAYADPVVSDRGAVQTPVNMRIGSSRPSTCGVYRAPVLSDPGTYLGAMLAPSETQSVYTFVIDPGHSVLVMTQQASGNAGALTVAFSWWET